MLTTHIQINYTQSNKNIIKLSKTINGQNSYNNYKHTKEKFVYT